VKADLTRSTFDQRKQFSRVLMQQGRVQLDSDWNEQVAILLHYMQTLAADIIGPHGGPQDHLGFQIIFDPDDLPEVKRNCLSDEERKMLEDLKDGDFAIGTGRYYVDGVLCENESYVKYTGQPCLPNLEPTGDERSLVYLDVWERHITSIEDPDIREVALGGPDTATRAKVVWQVKVDTGADDSNVKDGYSGLQLDCNGVRDEWKEWVEKWQPANRGMLKAKGREDVDDDSAPCIISPEARYRGAENQLYRVEIHTGSKIGQDDDSDAERGREDRDYDREREASAGPTFKWSRDNGSVTFPIRDLDGSVVTLESLGRDDHQSLRVGDLVEIVDDDYVLQGRAEPLLRVEEVDVSTMRVTLDGQPPSDVGQHLTKHPLLRRWDHASSASQNGSASYDTIPLQEDTWLTLEDGIQINFQPAPEQQKPHQYRTGDYWLIPARTVTGDVEWPGDVGDPDAQPPHGVDHHYAPLAIIQNYDFSAECRCEIERQVVCPPPSDDEEDRQ
jgi:hypothetical protein